MLAHAPRAVDDARTPNRLRIGTVPLDPVTLGEAVDRIDALIAAGRGGLVVTPNVDHVVKAERDAEFRAACQGAHLSVADGMPLVWASGLLAPRLPGRVCGADLILPLGERAARRGWRVYLLGGSPGVAPRVGAAFARAGADVVGTEAPALTLGPGGEVATRVALARIRAAAPHLLLLGLGTPKQEIWAHRHLDALRPAVVLGVGAGFDFAVGARRRAPRWMREAGLEWLHRLACEPRRLGRRYLVDDPAFLAILLRTWRERRAG